MISPDLLRTFLSLAETRNFTRTAEHLHMTQPGVSQHVKKLEDHFDALLIQRDKRACRLTPEGQCLVEHARQLFAEHERFRESLAEDLPSKGQCRHAAPGSFGLLLYDVLLECGQEHRGLRLDLTVAPTLSIPERLLRGEVDVGFTMRAPEDPRLEAKAFAREAIVLVVPKSYRGKGWTALKELGRIDHPDGMSLANRLLAANFPGENLTQIPVRGSINQINRLLDPVRAGIGFNVVSEYTWARYPWRRETKLLELPHAVRDTVYLVKRRKEKLPSRYIWVEECLRAALAKASREVRIRS